MSWFSTRGEEPIQAGSSQLLFPVCSILVGLVGALMARSYICTKKNCVHIVHVGMDASVTAPCRVVERYGEKLEILTLLTASVAMPSMAAPPTPNTSLALESMKSMAVPIPLSSFLPLRSPFTPAILPLKAEEIKRLIETDTVWKGTGIEKRYFLCCLAYMLQHTFSSITTQMHLRQHLYIRDRGSISE